MEDIKTIHIMIFIVITALLYHFMNSGCSCGKLGGVVEGLVDSTAYCGGRRSVDVATEGTTWLNMYIMYFTCVFYSILKFFS